MNKFENNLYSGCNIKNHIFSGNYYFLHIHKTAGSAIKQFFGLNGNAPSHHPLTDDIIKAKKIVTVVRNPYDRMVSTYKYRKGKMGNNFKYNTFKEYITDNIPTPKYFEPQVNYIKLNDKIIEPHTILRYESLKSDLSQFISDNNLKYNIDDLKSIRVSTHKKDIHYKEFYTDELRDIVFNLYQDDFNYFNYDSEL
ncbi:MAG: hypothetical protein CMC82_10190 [Flavobacteriaceae bacterium]|nr:hypothetical protein [Flavobacteriaceae bacterium]